MQWIVDQQGVNYATAEAVSGFSAVSFRSGSSSIVVRCAPASYPYQPSIGLSVNNVSSGGSLSVAMAGLFIPELEGYVAGWSGQAGIALYVDSGGLPTATVGAGLAQQRLGIAKSGAILLCVNPWQDIGSSGSTISGSHGSYIVTSGHYGSGSIASGHLASGFVSALSAATINSGDVTSGKIGNAAVVSGSVASGQIGVEHLISGLVSGLILAGQLGSGQVGLGNLTSGLVSGFVSSGQIASGQVAWSHFSSGLASGLILSGQIGSGQVSHWADASVRSGTVASGQLFRFHLADAAVFSGSVGSGQIASGHMTSGFVSALGGGSLTSGQVTSGYIGNAAVVSGSVASGQLFSFHIAAGGVQSGQIASGQVGVSHLADAAVQSGSLASGQVGKFHVCSGAIGSGQLATTGTPTGSLFLRDDYSWQATGGSVLTKAACTSVAAGSDMTWLVLAANSADITGVTLTTVMTVTGVGVGRYNLRVILIYQSTATTTGMQVAVNHTGTLTQYLMERRVATTGGAAATAAATEAGAAAAGNLYESQGKRTKDTIIGSVTVSVDAANSDMMCVIEGFFVVSVTGSLEIKLAAELAGLVVRAMQGSSLELHKLS